jgi:RNA polymerase-binding transcription factor DksA
MQRRNRIRGRRKPQATTEQVLGMPTPKERISRKWRSHYRRLTELRDHLLRHQTDLAHDALEEQPNFSTHMADAGTDTYDRDFTLGMLSSEQDALYQIEQALDRIRHGTYGICELTGKRIEPKRLDAVPWARFSIAAEKQLEGEGTVKRVRLGERDSVAKTEVEEEVSEEEE